MFVEALRALYGYNRWATERVLEAADGLSPEELLTPGTAGHGSIRDTLVHLIAAQRGWLSWWNGSLTAQEAIALRPDPADFPDLAAVRAAWEALEGETEAFVSGLGDDQAARVYSNPMPDGTIFRMPLWQMMLHVANHSTQHRTEVAAMLTGFDHSPGNLDLLGFFWTPGGGR
jgi:uncharacterized damage-inducible protein DinB